MLEQCPSLGGLTRTVDVGDFAFDYTGHFLHLCRYKTPADIPYAYLNNQDWKTVKRRSCCFVAGRMIEAPIQYNLGQLPPEMLQQCMESYEHRPKANGQASSFSEFVVRGFGQYLADLFLIPQNEKTMAIALGNLSIRAVKRFFPPPDETLVRAGIRGTPLASHEYNSNFWYPQNGGIGALVKGLGHGLSGIRTNQQATLLDLVERKLYTSTGQSFHWDHLFSSIPLKSLCQITNDPELQAAGNELSHSSTISFNLGLQSELRPEFAGVHWIYVPDRSIPFYRVGFYSNISKGTCTPGNSAVYVEVGVPGGAVDRIDIVHELQPSVLASLEHLGWIDSRSVKCIAIHVIRHAYIHHTEQRERVMPCILARLERFGVYPFGRYGLWDYMSMEDSMESACSAVRKVL